MSHNDKKFLVYAFAGAAVSIAADVSLSSQLPSLHDLFGTSIFGALGASLLHDKDLRRSFLFLHSSSPR